MSFKLGIIGGTGMDDPDLLAGREEKFVETPFGKPSDALIHGTIGDVPCVLLARHGRKHTVNPTNVNYRANMWALRDAGCTHVLVTTACGSLQEEINPGEIVLLDQFIDRTNQRPLSCYDGSSPAAKGVFHIPMAEPFCKIMRKIVGETAAELNLTCHASGTAVTIEGPRFSTRAESNVFRSWGAQVVNMTTVPEAPIANELGLCYAAIALPTDYDCWKVNEAPVDVPACLAAFRKLTDGVKKLLIAVIPKLAAYDWTERMQALKTAAETSIVPGSDV
ncbi:S-methyl-5'-thioadenosine phosphorylase-like [Sycon ciliatum]|uniref:S-methyl-5'-thioadenosine phosphorylase-like n=1 Tax=Sycon ciliatum TaxID=27933 RepID=UPI0031F69C48